MNVKYRVIIKVGYSEAYFDFDDAAGATLWATTALQKHTGTDESRKDRQLASITLKIINKDVEQERKEDDDE